MTNSTNEIPASRTETTFSIDDIFARKSAKRDTTESDMAGNQRTCRTPVAETLAFRAGLVHEQTPEEPWPASRYERDLLSASAGMSAETARDLTARNFIFEMDPTTDGKPGIAFQTMTTMGDHPVHGAITTAALTITAASGNLHGGYFLRVTDSEGDVTFFDGTNGLTIELTAEGDWEGNGLADRLVQLGEELRRLAIARRRLQD